MKNRHSKRRMVRAMAARRPYLDHATGWRLIGGYVFDPAVQAFLNAHRGDGSVWQTLPDTTLASMQTLFCEYLNKGNWTIYDSIMKRIMDGDALGATRALLGLVMTHVQLTPHDRRAVVSLLARRRHYPLHSHAQVLKEALGAMPQPNKSVVYGY